MENHYNKRRVMVLMVVVLVIVLSFFAGRYSINTKTYIQPSNQTTGQTGSDRAGIPPDSLPH